VNAQPVAHTEVGMNASHSLSRNLKEAFAIHGDAHDWLMALWNAIQVFDDMADGDFPDREDLIQAVCDTLCLMPGNPFFQAHSETLLPILAMQIYKWKAADDAEREGSPTEMSFAWRAGFYEVVLCVVQLVHGRQVAMDAARHVMNLYGENYADYVMEFSHA
jgi:hypothetical protein